MQGGGGVGYGKGKGMRREGRSKRHTQTGDEDVSSLGKTVYVNNPRVYKNKKKNVNL